MTGEIDDVFDAVDVAIHDATRLATKLFINKAIEEALNDRGT